MKEDKWWDNKPEKKEKKKKFLIPNLTPKYLQDNKLWDSYWLKDKYKHRF